MRTFAITTTMILVLMSASVASATVLYDATLGGMPSDQGWLYLTEDPIPSGDTVQATVSSDGTKTTLDTTPDIQDTAGFFGSPILHPGMTILDRTGDGFTLSFTLRLSSEFHDSNNNRAGLSIIVLTSDSEGIELGFWENSIWAQSLAFSAPAEATAFATGTTTTYDLAILDGGYSLYANDAFILAGPLRNYSAHPPPVYSETDLVFIGDNTTSADAVSEVNYVELINYAVPEPATLTLMTLGLASVLRRRRR
jgi:hypothetical protein